MISLHNIKGKFKIQLTDAKMMSLGDALIERRTVRIWVGVRNSVKIQVLANWGNWWDEYAYTPWRWDERAKQTRRARAATSMENERVPIHFTTAAKRELGI